MTRVRLRDIAASLNFARRETRHRRDPDLLTGSSTTET
jgi:hypothetical protein